MGLDMYLRGLKFPAYSTRPLKCEDGYPITTMEVELAYWRKHPDLHGFIVQQFGNGEDNCQKIYLNEKALEIILDAVKMEALPDTKGFFFGVSSPDDRPYSIEVLQQALRWIKSNPEIETRTVYYQASW
jgi:hypothetical protein